MTTKRQPSETPISDELWKRIATSPTDEIHSMRVIELSTRCDHFERSLRKAKAELDKKPGPRYHFDKCKCEGCAALAILTEALK